MNKISKYLMVSVMSLALFAQAIAVSAQTANEAATNFFGGDTVRTETAAGLGDIANVNRDPRAIAASIINLLMGFLGLIAVVIILMGGFKWMTAQGSDDKIEEAKKLLSAGVVGLVIILSAWGLATFVLGAILTSTQGA